MRCFCWCTPFSAVGSVPVDPVEHPGAQALDLAQAPLHVPFPFRPPLVGHVVSPCCRWTRLERVQRLARLERLRRHKECWCGRRGRWSLLVTTSLDAASGHHTGAHGGGGCALSEHVPTAAASWGVRATAATCVVANSTDRAMAGPLGPHVIERGRCQIN